MGFSWMAYDKNDGDLFKEFDINSQGLGLGDESTPHHLSDIRQAFCREKWGGKLVDAAQAAASAVQAMVRDNLNYFEGPEHDCPSCQCRRKSKELFGFDIEQAKRFLSIPIERFHRFYGGY